MKDIRKTALLSLCLMLLSACSLEEHPLDQIPEAEAYSSKQALFRNTVSTLYSYIGGSADGQGLQGTCRGVYDLQTFGSDEAILPTRGADWFDGGIWQQMYKHSWNAGHALLNNSWLYLYKVITLCNRSLSTIDANKQLAGADYQAWQAEVRALRAMYYWYLTDLFGDVPLVLRTDIQMNQVTRTPRSEVYRFCVNELEDVLPHLAAENSADEGDYYGRITQPVALFVLSKLMLNSSVYLATPDVDAQLRKCIDYCDAIEQNYGFRLESDFKNNFAVYNESSSENIFVIPMDKNLYSNQQQNLFRSYHYRHAAAFGFTGENGTSATRHTLQVFGYGTDEEDPRFRKTFYADEVYDYYGQPVLDRTGHQLIYYPLEISLDLSGSPYVETAGARMYKYEVDKNAPKDGKLMDNDIVLFRLADVLLMRAEAKYRLGIGDRGQADYDQIRTRSKATPRTISLQNLLDERLLELCWEGWRRQDLIRFGAYHSLYEGPDAINEADAHTAIYPIPAAAIDLNNNLTQNPGY